MTPLANGFAPTRRALLAGAACAALLGPARVAAVAPSARVTLSVAPFIAEALSMLVAEGMLTRDEAVTQHLAGTEAYRRDGAPLAVADLDPVASEVDRFLAIQLIEHVTGREFAAYLDDDLLPRLGIANARLVGAEPGLAVDCRRVDATRWA